MLPAEHKAKLVTASKILAELQQEMGSRPDRGSGEYLQTWQDLWWLREKLDEFIRYGFVLYRGELPISPLA